LTTWTPPALASEARVAALDLWRVVEAQTAASSMRLVDSLADQTVLERLLNASESPRPPGTERLHPLLATPFRYRPRQGSRFRASLDAGVWYGAEALRTALAEKGFWARKFLLDSPGTPDLKPVAHTAFRASVRGLALDLRVPPLVRDGALWTHPSNYSATQSLARKAREAGVVLVRYESVRDPERGGCGAVLEPAAFRSSKPRAEETWLIAAARSRVRCARAGSGGAAFEFPAAVLDGTAGH
jgi:hypothetical protein